MWEEWRSGRALARSICKTACLTTQEMIFQFQRIAETFQQLAESAFSGSCESTHFSHKMSQSEFQQFAESICIKCACSITHDIHLNCGCSLGFRCHTLVAIVSVRDNVVVALDVHHCHNVPSQPETRTNLFRKVTPPNPSSQDCQLIILFSKKKKLFMSIQSPFFGGSLILSQ